MDDKKSEYNKRYYLENRDKIRIQNSLYRKNNVESIKVQKAQQYALNPERAREQAKLWSRNHPETWKTKGLKRRYGITLDEYQEKLDSSCGRCAICDSPFNFEKREPCVDHNHDTGAVRGLLCQPCNRGLGQFKDDYELLQKAQHYLMEGVGNAYTGR